MPFHRYIGECFCESGWNLYRHPSSKDRMLVLFLREVLHALLNEPLLNYNISSNQVHG